VSEKAGAFAVSHKSCCRAIKTRATKRSIAFVVADARPFEQLSFLGAGRAFDREQRMLELWNNCCETRPWRRCLPLSSLLSWWPLALLR
jgi:hypothetical protein